MIIYQLFLTVNNDLSGLSDDLSKLDMLSVTAVFSGGAYTFSNNDATTTSQAVVSPANYTNYASIPFAVFSAKCGNGVITLNGKDNTGSPINGTYPLNIFIKY